MTRKTKVNSTQDKVLRCLSKDVLFSVLPDCHTRVFLIATNPVKEANLVSRIHCKNCLALGGFVYDSTCDAYILNCVDYLDLGTVPVSFVASMSAVPHWKSNVPASEKVLKKYFTQKQKKDIKKFVSKFDKDFLFSYIQMLDPNT
jgi:hypothetical protein